MEILQFMRDNIRKLYDFYESYKITFPREILQSVPRGHLLPHHHDVGCLQGCRLRGAIDGDDGPDILHGTGHPVAHHLSGGILRHSPEKSVPNHCQVCICNHICLYARFQVRQRLPTRCRFTRCRFTPRHSCHQLSSAQPSSSYPIIAIPPLGGIGCFVVCPP